MMQMCWNDVDSFKESIGNLVDAYLEDHKIFIPNEDRDRVCGLPADSFDKLQMQRAFGDVTGALLYADDWVSVVCPIEEAFMEKGINVCDNVKHPVFFTEEEVVQIIGDIWSNVETVVSKSPDKERFYEEGDAYRELMEGFRQTFREWNLLTKRDQGFWKEFVKGLSEREATDLRYALERPNLVEDILYALEEDCEAMWQYEDQSHWAKVYLNACTDAERDRFYDEIIEEYRGNSESTRSHWENIAYAVYRVVKRHGG